MKAKLIKDEDGYSLFTREENSTNRKFIATTQGMYVDHKLSKKNCDEIFGVVDLMKLAEENSHKYYDVKTTDWHCNYNGFFSGFQKAMELNKDKLFTLEDMKRAIDKAKQGSVKETHNGYGRPTEPRFVLDDLSYDEIIQSLKQPTEIEVEIDMECLDPNCDGINKKGVCIPGDKPKLDSNGCLILKKL
jgi:hypothetical protein